MEKKSRIFCRSERILQKKCLAGDLGFWGKGVFKDYLF
jgi:hypothetical protein